MIERRQRNSCVDGTLQIETIVSRDSTAPGGRIPSQTDFKLGSTEIRGPEKTNFSIGCSAESTGAPIIAPCALLQNTRGAPLSLKRSPTRLPTNYPHDWHLERRCPHCLEWRHLNWDWSYGQVVRARVKSFHQPQYKSSATCATMLFAVRGLEVMFGKIIAMPKRLFFRWILPAAAGMFVGFLALAYAVPSESVLPASLVALFSPGLKVAEFLMPAAHESLAWTFGWFLRIAIGVNAIFYFAIFALGAYLADRRRSQIA